MKKSKFQNKIHIMLLLFVMIRSVVKSVKVQTSISRPVAKLYSQYRCRWVRRTPCVCSPAEDGSVLIVVAREYNVSYDSVSAPRPLLVVGAPTVLCCCLRAEYPNLLRCVQVLNANLPACAESRKNSLVCLE